MKAKIALALLLAASNLAMAAPFAGTATVLRVVPQFTDVARPVQNCETVTTMPQAAPDHTLAGEVGGGVVGGLLAHKIGKGRGKEAATIAGSLAGAYFGDKVINGVKDAVDPQANAPQTQQVCRTQNVVERQQQGYLVTYSFAGRRYTEVLPYRPGRHLQVHGSLTAL